MTMPILESWHHALALLHRTSLTSLITICFSYPFSPYDTRWDMASLTKRSTVCLMRDLPAAKLITFHHHLSSSHSTDAPLQGHSSINTVAGTNNNEYTWQNFWSKSIKNYNKLAELYTGGSCALISLLLKLKTLSY